jgi:hypothetical protein
MRSTPWTPLNPVGVRVGPHCVDRYRLLDETRGLRPRTRYAVRCRRMPFLLDARLCGSSLPCGKGETTRAANNLCS